MAFAPAYPLWADNAAKIRHIRVPRGQSVRFDKQQQTFSIPANTRFYKTFLKKVVDRDGNTSYRKMETRLIVSRPDVEKPDGTARGQRAVRHVRLERGGDRGPAAEGSAAQRPAVPRPRS